MKVLILLVFFVIMTVQVYGALTDNMISYYSFDAGDVTDDHGANDGTNNGGNFNSTAKLGSYSWGTGSNNDYVDCNFGSTVEYDTFSVNFWFRSTGDFGDGNMIAFYDPNPRGRFRVFGYSTTGVLQERVRNSYSETSTGYMTGSWHMATLTNDHTGRRVFYVNGTIITNATSPGDILPDEDMAIGGRNINGVYSEFIDNVLIDEVAFWSRAITPTEVAELWNSGDGYNPLGGGPASNEYPGSGDWEVNCTEIEADGLTIDTNYDILGNNVIFMGATTGYLQIEANLTNVSNVIKQDGCRIVLKNTNRFGVKY